jgi:hypothetical protein
MEASDQLHEQANLDSEKELGWFSGLGSLERRKALAYTDN